MDKAITQMFVVAIVIMTVGIIGITVMLATNKEALKKLSAANGNGAGETNGIAEL